MHKRFAGNGLVIVTVSLDENGRDPKVQQSVRDVLAKRGANFNNVILDEEFSWVQQKLRFAGPPCVYVFNRQGQWKQFADIDDDGKTYQAIDRLVAEWLKEK